MPEIREEDMRETIPILMKPLVPAILTDDEELRQLGEDLQKMGCDGLLAQPWNVQDDRVLREFKFSKGKPVAAYQEEGAEKMDSEYMGESLRISERSRRRMGKPERWPVPRKIQRRGGPEGRTAPH
jgi:hypothetical protein